MRAAHRIRLPPARIGSTQGAKLASPTSHGPFLSPPSWMNERPIPVLTPIEARVLGVLVEKQLTVPDSYPLTLNAIVTGSNQKTSREPVMSITESDAQEALDGLRRRSLVIESSGGRAMRYAHNVKRVLGVPTESVALLAILMLRGPQTVAELRVNCDRLQRFSDASALEAFLEELAAWSAGALAQRLPRQPGARENRWIHLLCGVPADAGAHVPADRDSPDDRDGLADLPAPRQSGELQQRVTVLEARVATLDALVAKLCSELGLAIDLQSADAAPTPEAGADSDRPPPARPDFDRRE